jgi:transcriptional regulator with XRE-family HTH domain
MPRVGGAGDSRIGLVEKPDQPKDPVSQTLRNAVEAAGSVQALAGVLDVPQPLLAQWLAGTSTPPADVLLKAADLVYRRAVATLQRANKLKK